MGNFATAWAASVTAGSSTESVSAQSSDDFKVFYEDDAIAAGIISIDALFGGTLGQLNAVLIEFEDTVGGTGFTVSLDSANYSTRTMTSFFMAGSDAGAQTIDITTTAVGRLKVSAVGDAS